MSDKNDHAWTIVFDEDGNAHTQCPFCEELDTINERDIAVRWNRLSLVDNGTAAYASLGDSDFHSDGWICEDCLETEMDAPADFEVLDWS